ncbi:hypothetical protein AGABI2DRAFT_123018 [Agaricus bisporus var. bisporus H97]|uniref:hypothetical protein n=1 Tax=Agaricus bisporus var. bisporus (strain H97 / ATCC MYA-4626 / FGSC 10389) TaxID=936046 RepID=UPI00029F5B2A|nr:hypothetical protein AGABI2DRAFT_123018 [Agaricus bisporus var. bisporus H97]EKV42297.1 hypothetical protein AGABI2DRAFT_123018 [Agaricus bisporus var. bisporus H97]
MTDYLATSRCPYCLQTKPRMTSATSSPGDAMEDVVDAEIKRTESLISRLFRERTRLYRKRNEIRSPIYSLPPEILTMIFKFACPPLDFLQTYGLDSRPLINPIYPRILNTLNAVSARWRNIVLSTPSLWTSFVAEFIAWDDSNINIMQTIFSHSGNLPVAASLDLTPIPALYELRMAVLAPVLQEYASRIHMLYVYNAPSTWLKDNIPSFVNLELLCLEGDLHEDDVTSVDSTCTRLILKGLSCRFSLSCSKIEVLHLDSMPVDVCLELLQKCTHLIEYRLRDPCADTFDAEVPLPSSPFILPRLKLFEWTVQYESPVHHAMLQYIRMPALRTLVWAEEDINGVRPSSFLSTFFQHLPSTLSAIGIQHSFVHADYSIFSYFSKFSNIESLEFERCGGIFMAHVLNNLGSETYSVGNQKMPVLPKLKSIHVDRSSGDFDQAELLKTFRRRGSLLSDSLGSPFRVEFAEYSVNWTPEFKEELIRMVEKGYQVDLWEDSKPVDWLPR